MLTSKHISTSLLAATLLIAGCGGGGGGGGADQAAPAPAPSGPPDLVFELALTNLTLAQPLSPPAIALHGSDYRAFVDGEPASVALEILAEGGDRTDLLTEITDSGELLAAYQDANPVGPLSIGPTEQLTVAADSADDLRLTVVTMLVHTNDAFTGINAADVAGMAVGETRTFSGPTWDAGTENNTENAATMPGPDFGGEGFAAVRDDIIDRVRFHQGVVTSASLESGDPNSALAERHRFDNPTSRLSITRVQ
ncbi:MAG: spondin domain-containing protein [Pseudomonadota bacterium]